MHSKTHHYEWCSIYTFLAFSLRTLSQGQKLVLSLDAGRATMNFAVCMSQETILEELLLSKKEHNWTWMISVKLLFCMYYHFSLIICAWHSVAEPWLNDHAEVHVCECRSYLGHSWQLKRHIRLHNESTLLYTCCFPSLDNHSSFHVALVYGGRYVILSLFFHR